MKYNCLFEQSKTMDNISVNKLEVRLARPVDEPFLWHMVYYASQMDKDGGKTIIDAKENVLLQKYVADWGKPTDLGVIGVFGETAVGAVWSRLGLGDKSWQTFIDHQTPEIAAAILPDFRGQGIGSQLLQAYLDAAKERFTAVALNVRADNPAYHMYQRFGFTTINELTNRVGTKSHNMILRFEE